MHILPMMPVITLSNQVVYVLNTCITFNFSLLLRTLNVQYVMKHLRLRLTS